MSVLSTKPSRSRNFVRCGTACLRAYGALCCLEPRNPGSVEVVSGGCEVAESERSLDPVEGVAEVWLGEMETGAAVDGLAEMGGFAGREDAGAVRCRASIMLLQISATIASCVDMLVA